MSLSKEKNIGTFSIFIIFTVSLFLPPNNKGPKFTFPTSKNTLGSITDPTIRKFWVIFYEEISKYQYDS